MSRLNEKAIEFVKAVKRSIERFPLTVVFALVLTVITIANVHGTLSFLNIDWRYFLIWYSATGIVLTLSLSLWFEECQKKMYCIVMSLLIHIIWIGISLLIKHNYGKLEYAPYSYMIAALIITLFLSPLVLSFIKDKNDVSFWNFSFHTAVALVASVVVSGIVCGGIELLLLSIEKLFGANISENIYVDVAIICFFLLMPVMVIQGVPAGKLKHNAEPISMPKLIENSVTRLFTPIAIAYFITLYCYAAKILFTWQLPDGWVSWLVTASMAAFLILFIFVYPYRDKASHSASGWNRKAIQIITRWMPILMLPLLLLMSIGIARRISDYGITILRVYLVAFNLWCYAVCIVLINKRNAGIMWIPVSLVLTFAVLTLLPVNVSTYVRKNLTSKVTAMLQENGWNGAAMGDDEYGKFLSKLDSSVSHQLDSRIDYLKRQFSRQSVKDIVETGVLTGRIPEHVFEDGKDGNVEIHRYRSILGDTSINLPQNASKMCLYEYNTDLGKDCIKDEILTVELPVEFDYNRSSRTLKYEFHIPLSQLRALEEEMTPDNIIKDDFNHVVSLTGTLVNASAKDAPAKVILFLDTFHLRHDGKDGYIRVTGPLFF